MDEEEIAFKIVELYTKEVADPQEKKRMGLDTVLNAYFYTLLRLTRKKKEMEAFDKAVTKEEEFLTKKDEELKESKEELPKMENKPEQNIPPSVENQGEKIEEFHFD